LLNVLVSCGYLAQTADEPPAFLPRQDIATIILADLLANIRRAGESPFLMEADLPPLPVVDAVLRTVSEARERALEGRTLRDLVLEAEARPAAEA
jgi:hypothetical protein